MRRSGSYHNIIEVYSNLTGGFEVILHIGKSPTFEICNY